jgi:hypothetical protein
MHKEIKSRLNPVNTSYHSVQNLILSSVLSKTTKIKIYEIFILSLVLWARETWSLTLRGGPTLRVFHNRVLKTKTHRGLSGRKHQDAGENFIIRSFIPSIRH